MRSAEGHHIRRAEPADREAVQRELAAYFAFLGEALDPAGLDHDVTEWEREYGGDSGAFLVVVDATGEVIGTAGIRRLEPGVGELKRMWLRPGSRGLGLGRFLMDRCLEEARALGYRILKLDSERRLEAAVRLYRSYGFKEIPDYNGNPRAEIWMQREI
ncbi:MAG TPA: GNAT family N-acetyltransferase [Methylomirabilota bacterium]|nr:GNAT family N-acetyltransferase [Methylomirabilota bacterium]